MKTRKPYLLGRVERGIITLIYGIVIAMCLLLSYFLASIGQPNAVWIWRDILGVI